jgi:hypothetical protein
MVNANKIKKLYQNPKFIFRYLSIKQQDIHVEKSSNLFIGGIAGRAGTTWLTKVLENITAGNYAIIKEHGVFALSQIRNAGVDYYQNQSGRADFLNYLYKYATSVAYNRRAVYGEGLKGFMAIVPKRAIKLSFLNLKQDLEKYHTLEDFNKCFGRFYSSILNYHALLKTGRLNWINKEPGYGRYINDLYKMMPNCKVVIMIRDGRDTALSMSKREWFNGNLVRCIEVWKTFAEMTLKGLNEVPQKNYLLIKYEDLISEFKNTMVKILNFYGLSSFVNGFKDIDMAHYEYKPRSMNFNKWEKELSQSEMGYFEETCKDIMRQFGYVI